jgi:hypothetical protein
MAANRAIGTFFLRSSRLGRALSGAHEPHEGDRDGA